MADVANAHYRAHIFGQHVADYMRTLEEEDEDAFKRQFGKYVGFGIKADQLENLYKTAHEQIRADPVHKKKDAKKYEKKRVWNKRKMTLSERKNRIAQKKATYLKKLEAQAE